MLVNFAGAVNVIKLRDYQRRLRADIDRAWQDAQYVLAVSPTGSGKTVTFADLLHDHSGASAAVAHRKEIITQISLALGAVEVRHRIVAPPATVRRIRRRHLKRLGKSWIDDRAMCGVASVQTLTSKSTDNNTEAQRWIAQVTKVIFDEGHHYVEKGVWAKAVHMFDAAKHLFITATPDRADGIGLGEGWGGFAQAMVEGPTVKWLIEQGYLSPFKYYAPETDLDVSDIPMTADGDFNSRVMRARVVDSHLVGDVVKHALRFAPGKKAIVFSTDVETATEQAEAFRQAGDLAMALSGQTDPGERDAEIDRFESGDLLRLVNVDLFDEGFDVPGVDACIMARPTMSLAKFLQMIGRALRPVYAKGYDLGTAEGRRAAIAAGPKPYAIIVDMVRNWERHGMPDWPRVWSLAGKEKKSRTVSDTIAQRNCLGCTQPYPAYLANCPFCGWAPERTSRGTPEAVDGDLFELDTQALAALFEKQRRAEMDVDELQVDMARRNIPPIGRPAVIRKHNAGKYRRGVLRNLLGWWIGCQPEGRDLAEKQRRFYLRFGVDMATAMTLDVDETNKLIDRLKEGFSYDMY